MKRTLSVLWVSVALVYLAGCGGGLYVNKGFSYKVTPSAVKLAMIPVVDDDAQFIDSISVLIFDDTGKAQSLVAPADIRQAINADDRLISILNKLGSVEYTKDDFKQGPSILKTLTDDEFDYLKVALDNSDVVLFPVVFYMSAPGYVTSGTAKMRLYELETGLLIYEKSQDLLVERAGEHGRKFLALGLLGFARDDYNKYYWDKHIGH
ncbi:MAG: hypothetical protein JSV52_08850 [Candidatus Zixiibacteriota bacterium]|nr:MAG: hypothetical protein JSV52_08850 [candidate division Zixibacteria bacterium]